MNGGWHLKICTYENGAITHTHLMPKDDLREHVTEMLTDLADPDEPDVPGCWCNPFIAPNGMVAHNSLDGREQFEEGGRRPS